MKGVGAFALADGDPRRSTESRKMTSHTYVHIPITTHISTYIHTCNYYNNAKKEHTYHSRTQATPCTTCMHNN